MVDRDEQARLAVRQRAQQHAVDGAEDRRRRPDAEGEWEDDEQKEARGASERAGRTAEVGQHGGAGERWRAGTPDQGSGVPQRPLGKPLRTHGYTTPPERRPRPPSGCGTALSAREHRTPPEWAGGARRPRAARQAARRPATARRIATRSRLVARSCAALGRWRRGRSRWRRGRSRRPTRVNAPAPPRARRVRRRPLAARRSCAPTSTSRRWDHVGPIVLVAVLPASSSKGGIAPTSRVVACRAPALAPSASLGVPWQPLAIRKQYRRRRAPPPTVHARTGRRALASTCPHRLPHGHPPRPHRRRAAAAPGVGGLDRRHVRPHPRRRRRRLVLAPRRGPAARARARRGRGEPPGGG
jgi:hypothetical protein